MEDRGDLKSPGRYPVWVRLPPSAPFLNIMWYVYLLRCSDSSLYCGITNDIQHRLKTHEEGKGAKYTRGRLPIKLAYTEVVENKSEALKREIQIKKLSKNKKEELINGCL